MRSMRIQTVLLVEDDKDIRKVYGQALEMFGYNVLQAASVERGLELWRKYLPDMVVLDWMLSGKTGENFLQEWLQTQERCPVLVCCATAEYAKYAEQVYGVRYLLKPFDLDVFERAVEMLLAVEVA